MVCLYHSSFRESSPNVNQKDTECYEGRARGQTNHL